MHVPVFEPKRQLLERAYNSYKNLIRMSSFFRGTSATQDPRFADKEKKLRKALKFPASFKQELDISKVELKVIR